ncbi:MAG TPA: nitronate monooxygenase [Vicinamibacterales bacterium]|jgi:nitronate monooxygenase|nr:nitronate monooxygenase [Vicinamibacterales bacterium]
MSSLTELLSLRHPIVQSGMGRVAGPELAAEVSRAGGLGILAGLNLTPDDLRQQINRIRELTDRPFGVNLWLHPALMPPVDPAALPRDTVGAVQEALAPARRAVGLSPSSAAPPRRPDQIAQSLDVVIAERVPVLSVALGLPAADVIERCHAAGVRVMAMVANVADARDAEGAGVDIIVAQGAEAGGHRSTWRPDAPAMVGTFALVPEVADAVRVPVVAAGGIADGRGLVAALALGAVGVLLGTRFVATRESMAPDFWKQAILAASASGTTVTTAFTGMPARVLTNRFEREYAASGAPVLPGLLQAALEQDIWLAAARAGNADYFPLYSGQSAGIIRDVPSAADQVAAIVREAEEAVRRLRL